MPAWRVHYARAMVLIALGLLCLGGLGQLSTPAAADTVTVSTFDTGEDEAWLTFKESTSNASARVEVPRGCTVLSASLSIEGLARWGDDVRTLDFDNFNAASVPHRAWRGWVQGNYPPTYPFWNPYRPQGTALIQEDYDEVGASDDDRLETGTGQASTNRYPFHLFRFQIPAGKLTGLSVEWEGFGYCLANSTTRGAEMFLWKNGTRGWEKVDWYSRSEAAQDRLLEGPWSTDFAKYVDSDELVFVLILGKRSQNVAGPNPWTAEGEIHTDYVRLNATLEGELEYVSDVTVSVEPTGEIWSHPGSGEFGSGLSFDAALQAAVDAEAVEPGNITVPLVVNVSAKTAGVVRLKDLRVVYEPLQNAAPAWGEFPDLEMDEDEDAEKLIDLSSVAYDDHSHGSLVYSVVQSSTDAIQAVVVEGRFLSFRVREANWNGRATFRLNATDAWGLSNTSGPLELEVREVNDRPIVTVPGRRFATQDEPFQYTVEAWDVESDPLVFSVDTDAFGIDEGTGEINFTPTNDHVGLHRVNISVSDGRGGLTTVLMELQVDNVNDPPTIRDPGPFTGRQGEDLEHSWTADDPDLPHGDILSWYILGDDFYRSNIELNPLTGDMAWHNIGNGDVGEHRFTVQVVDSGGGEDRLEVVLTIENVNDRPSFLVIPDLQVFEDARLDYTIRVSDPDLDVDPSEALTWTVDPPLFEVSSTGTFAFKPGREHVGTQTVTVTVTDRAGASLSQSFKIVVKHVNHPPVIQPVEDQTVGEDVPWTLLIVVADPDPGDLVELSTRGAPFRVPIQGGAMTWTPLDSHVGEHLVTIEATDSVGAKATMSFNLTVVPRNDPPIAVIMMPMEGQSFEHDDELNLFVQAEDEEGHHLTIVWMWRFNDSLDQQWTRLNTGATVFWPTPPDGRILLRVEVSDGESTTVDEVVFEVDAPPEEEEGGSSALWVGLLLVIVVVLILLLLMRGRMGKPSEEVVEGQEPEEWKVWNEDGTPWLPE